MMTTEFKLKDALAVAREEAKGIAKGMKKLLALWEKGVRLSLDNRLFGYNLIIGTHCKG
jgi:hypothetical protein